MNRLHFKAVVLVFLFVVAIKSNGQELVSENHFGFNYLGENAAYAGSRNNLSVVTNYRYQKVKSLQSPKSSQFNAHMPIKESGIGIGVSYYGYQHWVVQKDRFVISGSKSLDITESTKLSLGLNIGMIKSQISNEDRVFSDYVDPLNNYNFYNIKPTIGFGFLLQKQKSMYGISIPNVLSSGPIILLDEDQSNLSGRNTQIIFLTSNAFSVGDNFIQLNTRLITGVGNVGKKINVSTLYHLKDKAWAGIQVKNSWWLGMMTGVTVLKNLDIGYTYEILQGDLEANSHEIFMRFELDKKERFNSLLF